VYRYLQNANVVVNIDCTLYVHGGVYGKLVFIATIRCRVHHLYAGIFDTDVQSCVGRHPKQHSSDLRALASQNVSKEKKAWIDGLWAWMVCQQFAPFFSFLMDLQATEIKHCIANPSFSANRSSRNGQALFLYSTITPTPR
jgi:hypothetical protein